MSFRTALVASVLSMVSRTGPVAVDVGGLTSADSRYDFGNAYEGDLLRHVFSLRVSGSRPVTIREVRSSCGCLAGKLTVMHAGQEVSCPIGVPIDAGTALSLAVDLRTTGRRGKVDGVVTVTCGDGRESCEVRVTALIESWFDVSPQTIDFGSIGPEDLLNGIDRHCEIAQKSGMPFTATVLNDPVPDGVGYKLSPIAPSDDGTAVRWRLAVRVSSPAERGSLAFSVAVAAAGEFVAGEIGRPVPPRSVRILATARICGVVSCEPETVSFGIIHSGEDVSRLIKVRCHDSKALFDQSEVRLVSSAGREFNGRMRPYLVVKTTRLSTENGVDLQISVGEFPISVSGVFQCLVEVGPKGGPVIRIPLSGVCRPQQ